MITIYSTPPETFFAGNPVLFTVNSDNMYAYLGRHCQFVLVISAAETAAGRILQFVFQDKTIVFTTAVNPDDSGLEIPTALNSGDWATWGQTIFDCLLTNFVISSRFEITIDPDWSTNRVIRFVAREEGAGSSATVTTDIRTANVYSHMTGTDSIPRSNFSIVGGIWDTSNRQIAQDVKPVNSSGAATFNFSEYLSVLMENDVSPRFTWPFDYARLYNTFTNYILEFYAGFAERYEGTVRKLHFDTPRNAFPGGLNRETMVAYNAAGEQFFSVAENLLAFMTWAPLSKYTSKTCPELLFYHVIAKAPYSDLELAVAVTFTDNTTDSFLVSINDLAGNTVIELSVGYPHMDFATRYPTKNISKWQVKLVSQDEHMDTEIRTFILDNQYYESERVFIFQNSYGKAYDVVRFTGRGSMDIDVDFSTSSSDTIGNYTSFNAPVSKFSASEVQKMKCNSGWISRETKDYMRELLLSKQVFEYKDNSLYPVVITNDKIKEFFRDDEYLYNIEIDYDRAYRDFFFQST